MTQYIIGLIIGVVVGWGLALSMAIIKSSEEQTERIMDKHLEERHDSQKT